MDDEVCVEFEGVLYVTPAELADAAGNAGRAVQNALGRFGVEVDEAHVNDHTGPTRRTHR